ncbi:hypothetical protein ACS7SF_26065 (plasmid) [Ralstonia sp. 25C]|uniref:hypothetical protein n=1 Tax=Ralstonia sp. 25C TaxID=3447363 RepID=UPI003F756894
MHAIIGHTYRPVCPDLRPIAAHGDTHSALKNPLPMPTSSMEAAWAISGATALKIGQRQPRFSPSFSCFNACN